MATVLIVGGCSMQGGQPTPVTSQTTPTTSTPISTAATGTSGQSGTVIDSSHMLTPSETEQQYQAYIEKLAVDMKLDNPPKVARVRYIRPEQQGQAMVPCLAEFGIPATSENNGAGYGLGEIPASQDKTAALAVYTCEARFPIHPQYLLPTSPAAWSKSYDVLIEKLLPCYESHGYTFAPPPSREAYIAGQGVVQGWSLAGQVKDQSGGDQTAFSRLVAECPGPSFDEQIEHPPDLPK